MEKEITLDIVTRVKNALGITDEIDTTILYSKLCDTVISCHPDRVNNEEAKQIAEEKFKKLNPLREEFKAYLEKKKVSATLATYENEQQSLVIASIDNATDKELIIIALQEENKHLKLQLQIKEKEYDNLQKDYDAFIENTRNTSKENLNDIYKPNKIGNTIGIGALITLLASLLPQVKDFITTLGVNGNITTIVLFFFTFIWIAKWIRAIISLKFIQSIIDKVLIDNDLMLALNIRKSKNKYKKAYFTEIDVSNLVNRYISKWLYKILYFGSYNNMKRKIADHIILELEHKNFIVSTETKNMQKVFYINIDNPQDVNDSPF